MLCESKCNIILIYLMGSYAFVRSDLNVTASMFTPYNCRSRHHGMLSGCRGLHQPGSMIHFTFLFNNYNLSRNHCRRYLEGKGCTTLRTNSNIGDHKLPA